MPPPPNTLSVNVTVTGFDTTKKTATVSYAGFPDNVISVDFRPPGSPQAVRVTLQAPAGANWAFAGPGSFNQTIPPGGAGGRIVGPGASKSAITFTINRGTAGAGHVEYYHGYEIVQGGVTYAVDPMIEIDD
jgi:hypothetical protein